jgi:hypothetical protein
MFPQRGASAALKMRAQSSKAAMHFAPGQFDVRYPQGREATHNGETKFMTNISDPDQLWEPSFEGEDIAPALGDAEIAAWEHEHKVRLPQILKRAYRQQNGGRVPGSERGAAIVSLGDICPVDLADLDMTFANEDGRFNTGRLFDIGYDDTGANILLHYPGPANTEPTLYFHYNDGGTLGGPGIMTDDLWAPVSE